MKLIRLPLTICICVSAMILSPAAPAATTGEMIDPAAERVGVTDSEVTIGSCVPLSGNLKERGKEISLGANLYFNYVNEQGGVNGRKIKLVSCDDVYDPEQAIECFNGCLKGKAFAGAFFAGSAPISKYVRLGEVTRMPMMAFCSGNPVAYEFRPTEFTFRPSYADEVQKQIDALWRLNGLRRIAVLYQNDAAGAAVREGVVKQLKKVGSAPVAEASFARKTTDLDAQINQVKQTNPEAVIFIGTSEGLLAFVKKRAQQKWNFLTVTFSIADDYLQGVKDADGVIITQVTPPMDDHLPGFVQYRKLLHKNSPQAQPNASAYEAFLNAEIISEGLRRAGTDLTRTSFVKALETLENFDLAVGPLYKVTYSAKNHNGLNSKAVYFTIVNDGKIESMTDADWKRLVKAAKSGKPGS